MMEARHEQGRKKILKILAIESSNQTMSVATMENGLVSAEFTRNGNLQHSTQLMPAIEQVMKSSGWLPQNVDCIAVAKGPGSYTGVRIGATIAKTLAWTLNKPLVPVSSLKVLAANGILSGMKIIPIIDARRRNLYTGIYEWKDQKLMEVMPDSHLASEELWKQLAKNKEDYLFVGQDIPVFHERIQEVLGERAHFSQSQDWLPRAGVLAALAVESPAVDAHLFTPEYLKKPEAEEKWQETHQGDRKGDYIERID